MIIRKVITAAMLTLGLLLPILPGPQAAPPAAELTNPSVGIGLAGVYDYATQLPFIDLMKTARPWTGHLAGRWGGKEFPELQEQGYLDEHGWPTRMPEGVSGLSTLILTDLPAEATGINGRYRLRYEGEGKLEINAADGDKLAHDGEAWFTAEAGSAPVIITIRNTDPNGTGDYLRNFTIVKEENIPAFDSGQVFNPAWIARIRDMRLLRFMDWMNTNNSTQSEWADRPEVGDFTYAERGVPLEIMIRLANEIGADPWFNIPHLATDDYIRNFATTVRDNLDSSHKAYVELSNEVWNWQFTQAQWAEQAGIDRWGEKGKWVQFYALRASQMAKIWDEVFADDAKTRIVKVIATQTGWRGLENDILTAPLMTAEGLEPPYKSFDAYAITGYFSGNLGNDLAPKVLEWIADSRAQAEKAATDTGLTGADHDAYVKAHRYDAAIDKAIEEVRTGAIKGEEADSLAALGKSTFPYHADVAAKYGLDLVMYEGGTHIVGLGEWLDNTDLTDFFTALNYSQGMAGLYRDMLDDWKAAGGKALSLYVDVGPATKWGSWGALRHLDDANPRWDAIETFNRDNPGWWETRPPEAFTAPPSP